MLRRSSSWIATSRSESRRRSSLAASTSLNREFGFHAETLRVAHHHDRENQAYRQSQRRDRSHAALEACLHPLNPLFRRIQHPFIEGIHLFDELNHLVAPGHDGVA